MITLWAFLLMTGICLLYIDTIFRSQNSIDNKNKDNDLTEKPLNHVANKMWKTIGNLNHNNDNTVFNLYESIDSTKNKLRDFTKNTFDSYDELLNIRKQYTFANNKNPNLMSKIEPITNSPQIL